MHQRGVQCGSHGVCWLLRRQSFIIRSRMSFVLLCIYCQVTGLNIRQLPNHLFAHRGGHLKPNCKISDRLGPYSPLSEPSSLLPTTGDSFLLLLAPAILLLSFPFLSLPQCLRIKDQVPLIYTSLGNRSYSNVTSSWDFCSDSFSLGVACLAHWGDFRHQRASERVKEN